jgi:hypothetical protein
VLKLLVALTIKSKFLEREFNKFLATSRLYQTYSKWRRLRQQSESTETPYHNRYLVFTVPPATILPKCITLEILRRHGVLLIITSYESSMFKPVLYTVSSEKQCLPDLAPAQCSPATQQKQKRRVHHVIQSAHFLCFSNSNDNQRSIWLFRRWARCSDLAPRPTFSLFRQLWGCRASLTLLERVKEYRGRVKDVAACSRRELWWRRRSCHPLSCVEVRRRALVVLARFFLLILLL